MRNLDHHAGAVASLGIATSSAAMRQVDQNLYALDNNVVRLHTLDAGYEADTTCVMLIAGVV